MPLLRDLSNLGWSSFLEHKLGEYTIYNQIKYKGGLSRRKWEEKSQYSNPNDALPFDQRIQYKPMPVLEASRGKNRFLVDFMSPWSASLDGDSSFFESSILSSSRRGVATKLKTLHAEVSKLISLANLSGSGSGLLVSDRRSQTSSLIDFDVSRNQSQFEDFKLSCLLHETSVKDSIFRKTLKLINFQSVQLSNTRFVGLSSVQFFFKTNNLFDPLRLLKFQWLLNSRSSLFLKDKLTTYLSN